MLQVVVSEFGVGSRSGVSLEAVTNLVRDALANPSVKVCGAVA